MCVPLDSLPQEQCLTPVAGWRQETLAATGGVSAPCLLLWTSLHQLSVRKHGRTAGPGTHWDVPLSAIPLLLISLSHLSSAPLGSAPTVLRQLHFSQAVPRVLVAADKCLLHSHPRDGCEPGSLLELHFDSFLSYPRRQSWQKAQHTASSYRSMVQWLLQNKCSGGSQKRTALHSCRLQVQM